MISKIKRNYIVAITFFILGVFVSTVGVYAITKLSSGEVSYDNSKSGGSSSDVQGSLEELYQKTKDYKPCSSAVWEANNKYFVDAYTYNPSTCVTGDEETCLRTDCYISSKKTCPVGTIIDYVVSGNSNKVRFHVMSDDGETVTMQTQDNIVDNVTWNSSGVTKDGPIKVLEALENATKGWTHVNDQTYTIGTTIFHTNQYTGCSNYNSCKTNLYTLPSRTAKARLLAVQEAASFGCTLDVKNSCPKWLSSGNAYWTMSAQSSTVAWFLSIGNSSLAYYYINTPRGARAVIEVSK